MGIAESDVSDNRSVTLREPSMLRRLGPSIFVILLFSSAALTIQYQGELTENDLYWTLLGFLNSHVSGRFLGEPLHYGKNFGFGYIELIYAIASPESLGDRQKLIGLINGIGYVCAIGALAGIIASVWMIYGERAALTGGILFGFSPLMLDLAASGHQLLPALACFGAASVAFLAETRGWRRLAAYAVGTSLLFIGLTMRAELPLAFPWLVLAQRAPVAFGRFFVTALQRSAACLLALGAFLALRHSLFPVPDSTGVGLDSLSSFVATWYRIDAIGLGIIYLVLGCGIATVAAFVIAAAAETAATIRLGLSPHALWTSQQHLLAPVSLILFGLLFWLPNPVPARHFVFVLLGLAVIIGVVSARLVRKGAMTAIGIGVMLATANQITSEAAHPLVISHLRSTYTNLPDARRTLTAVPLGFSWRHAATIQQRREAFTDYGRTLEATSEPRLLVLTSNPFHLATNLFSPGSPIQITPLMIGSKFGLEISRPGRRAIYLMAEAAWPEGALVQLMQSELLRDFKFVRDPYSQSIYDTPIPQPCCREDADIP